MSHNYIPVQIITSPNIFPPFQLRNAESIYRLPIWSRLRINSSFVIICSIILKFYSKFYFEQYVVTFLLFTSWVIPLWHEWLDPAPVLWILRLLMNSLWEPQTLPQAWRASLSGEVLLLMLCYCMLPMHGLEFSLPSQMLFFEQSWARDPQESMSMLHFFKKNFAESVLVVFFQCLVVPVAMRSPGLRNIQWSRDHCCSIHCFVPGLVPGLKY